MQRDEVHHDRRRKQALQSSTVRCAAPGIGAVGALTSRSRVQPQRLPQVGGVGTLQISRRGELHLARLPDPGDEAREVLQEGDRVPGVVEHVGGDVGGVGVELRVHRDHAQQGQRVAGGVVQVVRQRSRVRADHGRHLPGADDLVGDVGDQLLETVVLRAEAVTPTDGAEIGDRRERHTSPWQRHQGPPLVVREGVPLLHDLGQTRLDLVQVSRPQQRDAPALTEVHQDLVLAPGGPVTAVLLDVGRPLARLLGQQLGLPRAVRQPTGAPQEPHEGLHGLRGGLDVRRGHRPVRQPCLLVGLSHGPARPLRRRQVLPHLAQPEQGLEVVLVVGTLLLAGPRPQGCHQVVEIGRLHGQDPRTGHLVHRLSRSGRPACPTCG